MPPPPELSARAPAEFYLDVAQKLLAGRDLVGSRRFALKALDADPVLDGVDQVLAVSDVLLASEKRVNNHLDWYAVLRLDPSPTSDAVPLDAVRRKYRRLALLLNPDKNPAPGADSAHKLVLYAWSVLSDPVKRALYDKERDIALLLSAPAAPSPPPPPPRESFWTGCPFCYNVYEYARVYEGRNLRCQSCRRGFKANELKVMPSIVPGADAYYFNYGIAPPIGLSPPSSSTTNRSPIAPPTPTPNPFARNIPPPADAGVSGTKAGGLPRTKVKSKKGTTAGKAAAAQLPRTEMGVDGFPGNMMDTDISDVFSSYPRIYDHNGNEMGMNFKDFV